MAEVSVVVPLPAWVKDPVPEMELLKSTPCVTLLLRLIVRLPLLVIALLVDRLPVVPPLPSCSVPPLMVVVPV